MQRFKDASKESYEKILLVDEEQSVLSALRRELRDYYEIEAFDDPATAIERCRNTQFDLVVADYQMPYEAHAKHTI